MRRISDSYLFPFFFDVIDFVLEQCFKGLPKEFLSLFVGDSFDVVDDLSAWGVLGGGFEVVEVSGAWFEPVVLVGYGVCVRSWKNPFVKEG